MIPFRGTERRTSQMLHGASVVPPSGEGVRRAAVPCHVLLRPASATGPVSTEPSTVGAPVWHGARPGPEVLGGTYEATIFLVNPSRNGDKSHRYGTGTTACIRS
jgi:hypothetical protein